MTEILQWCWAFGIGAGLSMIYFFGLWKTLEQLSVARQPSLLLLGSVILRMGLVLLGFLYLVIGGHWDRLLLGLLGFLFIRAILIRRWGIQGIRLAQAKG